MTRPNTWNAGRAVACHTHDPSSRHWKAILKAVAYLRDEGASWDLFFEIGSSLELSAHTDIDLAKKANERRSATGLAVMLGNTAISR